jgi:hypothetical protein
MTRGSEAMTWLDDVDRKGNSESGSEKGIWNQSSGESGIEAEKGIWNQSSGESGIEVLLGSGFGWRGEAFLGSVFGTGIAWRSVSGKRFREWDCVAYRRTANR